MNTTENNKLIAEFMGLWYSENEYLYNSQFGKGFKIDELLYHSDWNWLMEVVEKIKPLNRNGNNYYLRLMNMTLSEALNIDYVYSICVEFIKWYNQQNQ
jgi:hypothetical protein